MASVAKGSSKRRAKGSVSQRKRDGRWRAFLTLPGGKRKALPGSWPTKADAEDALAKAIAAVADGLHLGDPKQTLAQYLVYWLNHVAINTVRAQTTLPTYRYYALKVISPALGKQKLSALTPQHVQAFYNEQAKRYAPTTMRLIKRVLCLALKSACTENLLMRNVATLAKTKQPTTKEIRPLTIEQTQQVFDAVREHRYGALYIAAAQLGLRKSEALGIRWRDIDWDAGTVAIVGTVHRVLVDADAPRGKRTRHVRLETTKSLKSRRTRVMPKATREALLRHRAIQAELRLHARAWKDTDGLLFTREDGSAADEGMISNEFHRVLDQLALPRVRIHDLRHGAVSQLIKLGASPKQIQEFVGHASILTTMNIYGHLWDDHAEDMAALMDAAYTTG